MGKKFDDKRFELETCIHDCWKIVDDLDTVYEACMEGGLSMDETETIITGLRHLYALKFNKLHEVFENCIG